MFVPKGRRVIHIEETFVFIAPEAARHHEAILARLDKAGFERQRTRMTLTRPLAEAIVQLYPRDTAPSGGLSKPRSLTDTGSPSTEAHVHAILSGTVWCAALSAPRAVDELIRLCGPADPTAARQSHPQSLRALYGIDAHRNGIFCAMNHEAAAALIHAAFGYTPQPREEYTVPDSAPSALRVSGSSDPAAANITDSAFRAQFDMVPTTAAEGPYDVIATAEGPRLERIRAQMADTSGKLKQREAVLRQRETDLLLRERRLQQRLDELERPAGEAAPVSPKSPKSPKSPRGVLTYDARTALHTRALIAPRKKELHEARDELREAHHAAVLLTRLSPEEEAAGWAPNGNPGQQFFMTHELLAHFFAALQEKDHTAVEERLEQAMEREQAANKQLKVLIAAQRERKQEGRARYVTVDALTELASLPASALEERLMHPLELKRLFDKIDEGRGYVEKQQVSALVYASDGLRSPGLTDEQQSMLLQRVLSKHNRLGQDRLSQAEFQVALLELLRQ